MTRPGNPDFPTRVWRGIEAIDPPWAAGDYPAILAMAGSMLAARQSRFPQTVAAGTLTRAEAEAQLATFAAIAADWRWIVTGEGQRAHLSTLQARRDALDASLDTIAAIARDERGFSKPLTAQAQIVIAMRWHLEPERRTHAAAALTHLIRADLRASSPLPRPADERAPSERKAA